MPVISLGARVPAVIAAIILAGMLSSVPAANAAETDEEIAASVATLLRSARAVISDKQTHINDAAVGNKGLSADVVVRTARENYKKATGKDVDSIDKSSLHGQLLQAQIQAVAAVMDEAQEAINKPGVGFKGFLPAVFARLVSEKFKAAVGDKATLKLTAPKEYLRNRANRADAWENDMIESQFKSAGYPKGKAQTATAQVGGRSAFRLILPEYYTESCMSCHGEPAGERDISGGKKEGAKLGALGGAISVVIFK